MTRFVVSKVKADMKIDVKINVNARDVVEAYHANDPMSSRVRLKRDRNGSFFIPCKNRWKKGDEVNVLINYTSPHKT